MMKKAIIFFIFLSLIIIGTIGKGETAKGASGLVTCGGPGQAPCTLGDISKTIKKAKDFLLTKLVPAFAVIMIMIGGINFLLAGASPEVVNNARKVLFAAASGLVISLIGGALLAALLEMIHFRYQVPS